MASPIVIDHIFNTKTIVKNTAYTYDFALERGGFEGFFSLQVQIVSGAGVLTWDFLESNDGSNFVDQGAGSDIVVGLNGTGFTMYSFEPMVCNKIRVRVTETDNAAGNVINAWLAAQ